MDENVKVFLGFLAGAATGAIAGILLAPEKGDVTRKNISDKASQLKSDVNGQVQKGVEKLNNLKQSAFSLINDYSQQAQAQTNP
ncbi:MAG: YtxH domain-containing protein [Sporocytophaga sp.]|uniref:YtxH domain-containing protein n=1 Tax=Sporocytophaga sp. TaxID=2231183 RepID=UPI001B023AF5|nr:YtxH domain-containing protein [Sporocytophaga sp.]MBO9701245.1 YtxH domain-containing protein [Sporocytophaga sp.]